jgi:16S rRNA (guanine966-N2)-methyltransferase
MGTLKLTGGTLRSRRVSAPSGRAVRPTPARVKEALFSILGSNVVDARVLDLFAGTGALGFEALSRGAAFVTFVEADRPVATALAKTARELDVADRCDVVATTAERMATRAHQRYDVVFADPPFAQPYPGATFSALQKSGAIDADTLVVYEHSSDVPAPADARFPVIRTAKYGAVALAFLQAAA